MAENTNTSTTKTNLDQGIGALQIQQLFKVMVDNNASDLHLTVGSAPGMRISGDIVRVKVGSLGPEDTKRLIYQILTEKQKAELEKNLELDFSFGIKGLARFRANVFYSKGSVAAVFRQIPSLIPDFDALGLPKVLLEMVNVSSGLFLVTGPTGSGKSTTLASIIDKLNSASPNHIITLEDPIEFVHQHKLSLVNQREIGADTLSFGKGIKSLLRQDPDIVLVGELRDTETIEAALTIAETGHVVFGTLHTNSTVQTINRIINVFSHEQQDQIRTLLSFVLQGVVAQQLLPRVPKGRALVQEILRITPAIRNLIREDKVHQIYSQMQIGQETTGMNTMNQHIKKHLDTGTITQETAMTYSNNPEELARMLGHDGPNKKR
ncbi:MAG TPA: type IV pilus twitching motility protein PilT [Bacteriovoracaceae bacterium]|nr:type IV pilus twitching motility protein PilT [Bacteriovoracaceae bacterium]